MSHNQDKLDSGELLISFGLLKQLCTEKDILDMGPIDFGPRYALWHQPLPLTYVNVIKKNMLSKAYIVGRNVGISCYLGYFSMSDKTATMRSPGKE